MKPHLALGAALGMLGGSLCALPACPGPASQAPPDVAYVSPTSFDASTPIGDALSPCQLACVALARAGCATFSDCPTVLGHIERDRTRAIPDGAALTCVALATAARPQDLGIPCHP